MSAAKDRDKLLRTYVASRVGQIPVAVGELLDENARLRKALNYAGGRNPDVTDVGCPSCDYGLPTACTCEESLTNSESPEGLPKSSARSTEVAVDEGEAT